MRGRRNKEKKVKWETDNMASERPGAKRDALEGAAMKPATAKQE